MKKESPCLTVIDENPFTITIFDSHFKSIVVQSTSQCDSAFITALPPLVEDISQTSTLVGHGKSTKEDKNDDLVEIPIEVSQVLTTRKECNDGLFQNLGAEMADCPKLDIDLNKPLSRSINERYYTRASTAKATRARLAKIQKSPLYITADGSPIRSEGRDQGTPLSSLTLEADLSSTASTPITYATTRTSRAELFATPPPSFAIRGIRNSPSCEQDFDPFIQSDDASYGEASAAQSTAGSLSLNDLDKKRDSIKIPGPSIPQAVWFLDVDEQQTSHWTLQSDVTRSNQSALVRQHTPHPKDQAGLEVVAITRVEATQTSEISTAKPPLALPLPNAAESAAMNQAHIHPAQRVYPIFLTSPTESVVVQRSHDEEKRPNYGNSANFNGTREVDQERKAQVHWLNNSWADTSKFVSRRCYPPRSSSLDIGRHHNIQACPGMPGRSVGSSENRKTNDLLSLQSILLEGPPRASQVAREEIQEEFKRGHDRFLASHTRRHRLPGLLPTTFSLPLAAHANGSPSSHRSQNSTSSNPYSICSAPGAVMQISPVTHEPIPGVLVPPHNQHVSVRSQWDHHRASRTPGGVASIAVAALKKRGSRAMMRLSSSLASTHARMSTDQEGSGRKERR